MHKNAIYICIFWYIKICWFLVKKCWCQQNSEGVSRDSYFFWIFSRQGITVPSFIIVGYVSQILAPSPPPPHPWVAPKMHILNSVNTSSKSKFQTQIKVESMVDPNFNLSRRQTFVERLCYPERWPSLNTPSLKITQLLLLFQLVKEKLMIFHWYLPI